MTNQQALCDSASALLARINPDYAITPDDRRTIESLCASYINLCEAQILASQRADKLQAEAKASEDQIFLMAELLQNARDTIKLQIKAIDSRNLLLKESESKVKDLRSELEQAHTAYHALLSGDA